MFTVTKYPQGAFSWVDCSTSDAGARHFYASLLGSDIEEAPMGGGLTYYTFLRDGHKIAALSELPPQMAHLPPSWNSYVTVDDVDALARVVQELGGTVLMEPSDISDNGRLLRCQDPQGATIAFWQPINHIGAGLVNTPGALCWNELWTADLQSSKAFYRALLGWTFEDGPGVPVYTTIWNQGRRNGGIRPWTRRWRRKRRRCGCLTSRWRTLRPRPGAWWNWAARYTSAHAQTLTPTAGCCSRIHRARYVTSCSSKTPNPGSSIRPDPRL